MVWKGRQATGESQGKARPANDSLSSCPSAQSGGLRPLGPGRFEGAGQAEARGQGMGVAKGGQGDLNLPETASVRSPFPQALRPPHLLPTCTWAAAWAAQPLRQQGWGVQTGAWPGTTELLAHTTLEQELVPRGTGQGARWGWRRRAVLLGQVPRRLRVTAGGCEDPGSK